MQNSDMSDNKCERNILSLTCVVATERRGGLTLICRHLFIWTTTYYDELINKKITITDSKASCDVCSGLIVVVINKISMKILNEWVQLHLAKTSVN